MTRLIRPAGWRVCCRVRSSSKLRVALREVSLGAAAAAAWAPAGAGVAPAAPCGWAAAWAAWAWAACAVAPGGVLLVAPGMPCGPSAVLLFSLTCSLRSFGGSPLNSSRASSVTEKSMSTVTSALTRPWPVSGSSNSRMRWL